MKTLFIILALVIGLLVLSAIDNFNEIAELRDEIKRLHSRLDNIKA